MCCCDLIGIQGELLTCTPICLGELAYFCGAKSVAYQPTYSLMGWTDMGTMSG